MDRKKIIFQSGIIVLLAQIVTSVISFGTRNAFIYGVGIDYLGLNGVIADILAMLSLTELGFQFAIVYRLYKPIAEDDRCTIDQILYLLKKIYMVIGVLVITIGVCVTPFLKYMINGISVPWSVILLSYLLYVLATAVTYFMAYKRTFLYAKQKQYVLSSIDLASNIFFGILKMISLAVIKSYLLFVLFYLLEKLTANIIVVVYVGKWYSWIGTKNVTLNSGLVRDVFYDTKNVFVGKIAGYIYSSTDSLVISSFISTRVIGYIGNYKTIFSTMHTILTVLFTPIRPMIGNYLAENDKKKAFEVFKNYDFLRYVAALVILGPTLSLAHVFIVLWLGEGFLLDGSIIYLLFVDVYISIVHGPVAEYVELLGYFQQMKAIYIIGAITNVILSIVGARIIGVEGVFLATVVSQIIMWVGRSRVVFTEYFMDVQSHYRYWWTHLMYAVNFIIVYYFSIWIIEMIKVQDHFFRFVSGGIISVAIALTDIIVIWKRSEKFVYLKDSLLVIFRERLKKRG